MKKRFLIVTTIFLSCILNGQQSSNYNGMILSLNGEGIVTRGSKDIEIKLLQRYRPGDKVTINVGNAIILLYSGEEIPLSAVSVYTIPEVETPEQTELSDLANRSDADQSLLAQAGVAYRIRGESNVFPMKSKLLISKHAILRTRYENPKDLGIKVIDSQTQKTIFEQDSISDSIILLEEAPFVEGRSYYWTLNNTPNEKPELGTIIVPYEREKPEIKKKYKFDTHFDYLNAISELYQGKYYFDALVLINEAIEKYPEFKIYKVLRENIMTE